MATTIFPTSTTRTATSTFTTALTRAMTAARGGAAVTQADASVASLVAAANPQGTGLVAPWARAAGITLAAAGTVETGATIGASLFWLSDQLASGVTIAGTITANLRAFESQATANYGVGCKLYKVSGNAVTAAFAQGSDTVELGTSESAHSISLTPTSTAFAANDQIGLLIFYVGVGTSASAKTATGAYNGPTSAASGDTFLTFTETLSFVSAAAATPLPRVVSQAVQRAATRCWKRRRSGIVVPRLWTPEAA